MKREVVEIVIDNIKNRVKACDYPYTWRPGQALFNICHEFLPVETNALRGTDVDCFYKDDKQEVFIEALLDQFN